MGHLDRYGEPLDPEQVSQIEHDTRCTGWLGEDADHRLVPCLICKPHLAGRYRRQPVPVYRQEAR